MSRLAEFRAAEKALAEQLAHLESLKNDSGLKKEIEFEEQLRSLMREYEKSLKDVLSILDPAQAGMGRPSRRTDAQRKARELKVYQNPHTGEIVETKGGNHRVLRGWKSEFGSDVVESWRQA
ncbi:transcriptional regulator MvaV [Pseudomonas sp. ATCC 13867]|uniref:histone-like nucleoid-structuring protein, MvaT/MvaU family n=1 Tax=Pseudomonas sp. ATCC 13867 TaxID=1294143 RepID=UPI0002C4E140|nr:histone-like nucleoid-structuring protein, MvaT/MvaU family [Pseudomonas sp. ATCC 13867]AGI24364.1 transcriptional regulator MvaV [Pseudomonas sp. ATCC 13867]RFQ21872.1 transcriptional regulator [Pseudomonas sp. ATCC 13867]